MGIAAVELTPFEANRMSRIYGPRPSLSHLARIFAHSSALWTTLADYKQDNTDLQGSSECQLVEEPAQVCGQLPEIDVWRKGNERNRFWISLDAEA